MLDLDYDILLGTSNKGKITKYGGMLKDLGFSFAIPNHIGELKIDENGKTTMENSLIKAKAYFEKTGKITFADDSGLFINGLPDEKQPGIFVKRYKGEGANDDEIIKSYSDVLKEYIGDGVITNGFFEVSLTIITLDGKIHQKTFKADRPFCSNSSNIIIPDFPLRSLMFFKEQNMFMSEMTKKQMEEAEGNSFVQEKQWIADILNNNNDM